MEPQRRAANVWTGVFDRLVARWRFAVGARRALGAEPVEAMVGDVPPTPEAPAARSEVASQVPAAQVHSSHRPVLVLNCGPPPATALFSLAEVEAVSAGHRPAAS